VNGHRRFVASELIPSKWLKVWRLFMRPASMWTGRLTRAAAAVGESRWEEAAEIIERVMEAEKKMYPNLDWPAGRLYHAMGLEIPLYTPIFVMSRITGWAAHIMEQLEHNRLIRPRARYNGPERRPVFAISE